MGNGDNTACEAVRYTKGVEMMLGDRVSWLSNDVDMPHKGIVVAVFLPHSKEACDWGFPNGGYLVLMEDMGLTGASKADVEMRLLARGNEQDVEFARKFMWSPIRPK